MSPTEVDYSLSLEIFIAAREYIRSQGNACIVSISQLLEELSYTLDDGFGAGQVVRLTHELWADAHVDQIPESELIEFAWSDVARY
jgi:hypothetical protein